MAYLDDIQRVADAPLPWQKLAGKNVLVTGATGLIGACLVEVLMRASAANCHVFALGRNAMRAERRFAAFQGNPRFHFVQHDLIEPLRAEVPFHFVIHAASNASPNFFASQPVEVMQSNLLGLCNLFDYGRCHGLERLLYVSSGEVYGEGDGRVFTEDYSGYVDPMNPRSCYPSAKRAAETLCVAYAREYGLESVVVRPSHTFGPHFTEADNRVYAQFITNVRQGQDIVLKSRGEQFRSWCYVVDCVSGILHVLLKGVSGEAYNIADDDANITIRQLAEHIAGLAGRKVVFQLPEGAEKAGYNLVQKSVFSAEKLRKLGWRPMHSWQESLQTTLDEAL